jgi:hypothetical protein
MNDELERMWKEDVVTLFQVLSQNFSEWTEETHENVRIADLREEI